MTAHKMLDAKRRLTDVCVTANFNLRKELIPNPQFSNPHSKFQNPKQAIQTPKSLI